METNISQSDKHGKALVLLAITAVMWSFGGLFIKLINAHPLAIAGVRSTIAALVLLLVMKKPRITWSFKQLGAALSCSATAILFVSANKTTTAANAILLQFTAPIYVALLGRWFLKEKVKLSDWVTIFFVLGGMGLFFVDKLSTKGLLGNILAAASGISFAFFTIFMRMQKDGSPLESVLLGNILTAMIGLPFLFVSRPDASGWLNLVILGVIQLGIPYVIYSKAIKNASALEAILIPVLEPLLNPVWVFLTLHEAPGMWSLVGGLIVLTAVTVRCVMTILPGSVPNIKREKCNEEV